MTVEQTPQVTVAVPVKDRRERMLRCLDALLAQDHSSFEVLVLDNCSSDGTGEACAQRAASSPVPLRVERMDGSVGRLRNAAGELGRGAVLAFTDSDCMPAPGWLTAGTSALLADAGLGVVSGRTLPDPAVAKGRWPATIEVTEETGQFESCNLFFRRDAFRRSDGFDEDVGHFYEDTAAGYALRRDGWRTGYAPEALVYHDVTHPGLGWWLRRAQRYGNAAAVVRKYPEMRRELLWGRYFISRRNAATVAAALGLALAPRHRRALVLTLPWLWLRGPQAPTPGAVRDTAEVALFDLAILIGTVRGSVRWRSLVL